MVSGDQGTEPLHASSRCPVDEMLLNLQQSVKGELQQLVEANEEVRPITCGKSTHYNTI